MALAGCHAVAGINEREVDPTLYDAGGQDADGGDAQEAGEGTCAFRGEGDAWVRLVHAHPLNIPIDLCFRPTQGGAWRRLFGSLPPGCPLGLERASATVAAKIPSGSYDVLITGGGSPCSLPLGEEDAGEVSRVVVFEPGRRHSILFAKSPDGIPLTLMRREFRDDSQTATRRIRFINLLTNGAPVYVGLTDGGYTGATMHTPIEKNLGFGESPPRSKENEFPQVDEDGYIVIDMVKYFGVAWPEQQRAFAASTVQETSRSTTASWFIIGTPDTYAFPPQLLLCDEEKGSGLFAECRTSLPPLDNKLVVTAFAADLGGWTSAYASERRSAIIDALAELDTDVLCLSQVASTADRDAIVEELRLRDAFPYSAYADTNRATPFDDPADMHGDVPPENDSPPCDADSPRITTAFEALVACLSKACSSNSGALTNEDCVSAACYKEYLDLATFGEQDLDTRCLSCLEAGSNDGTPLAMIRQRCLQDVNGGWTFDGHPSDVLLSKWPLVEGSVEQFVLPSTLVRRTIVRATLPVGHGGGVDVYCTTLGELGTEFSSRQYPGQYGEGASREQAWANEQLLQAQRLCGWVNDEPSKERSAVVAGLMNASRDQPNDQGGVLGNKGAPTVEKLEACFTPAVAGDYVPACTECTDNPLVLDWNPPGGWTTRLFMVGFPDGAVQRTERLFLDPTVPVTLGDGGTGSVPLSSSFGLQSEISLTGSR